MRSIARVAASCLAASVVLLAASAPASAAPKRITGKLTQSGYTVIALAADGEARSVRVRRRTFRLRPPAGRVTLHLRALNGRYAGPIVVGRRKRGRVALLGVRAGARLGKVGVRGGYARVAKRLGKKHIDTKRRARARRGVPIGARRFGRVRSRPSRAAPRDDRDLDGIPDPLDIDDDGDLLLDDVDPAPAGRAGATKAQQGDLVLSATTQLLLGATAPTASSIVNANAPGLSDDQIQSGLRAHGTLTIGGLNVVFPSGAELDCAGDPKAKPPRPGLSYCWAGGTGRRQNINGPGDTDPNPGPLYPACCDPDGDGFGSIGPRPLRLLHGAGADQIRGGDPLLVRGTTGATRRRAGGPAEVIASPATVLATVPAIKSYVDENGAKHDVSYPVAPGTPFPVVDGPDDGSDVSVALTFWRPQRRAIPGELPPGAGNWIDIGRLGHFAAGFGSGPPRPCPASSYSAVGQELVPSPGFPPNFPFFLLVDSVDDQAANPANTFSYTLNLSQCRTFHGGNPFFPGATTSVNFTAALAPQAGQPNNTAESTYTFNRPGGLLTIRKQTDPAESPASGTEFEFDPDDGLGGANFKLRHDGTRAYQVVPGTYTVDELAAPGYDLTGVGCDDSDSTGSTTDRRATFRIAAGERVTCIFTNKKL